MANQHLNPAQRPSQTKIVATVGPACGETEQLAALMRAGVDVFRINTAHGTRAEHETRLAAIREASRATEQIVAILVDLAGPKIRLGELHGGQLECHSGEQVRFIRGEESTVATDLTTTYDRLVDELEPGDRVMLADGTVALIVNEVDDQSATCHVHQGGVVRSRQGVNLPGVKLSVAALGEKDRDNALWAVQADVDYVSLSFVRTAAEVRQLKALIEEAGGQARVVAKLEKPEALENLTEIVKVTDVVMVARGDLGVEIDIAEVPVVQKKIVAECNRQRKPVIIATQMLDSMQHSRIPTRAEATDVANAILDGADACMLSGETAIGDYPLETVEMMHRISLATELPLKGNPERRQPCVELEGHDDISLATTSTAALLAERLGAKTLIVASGTGETALNVSKQRRMVPVVGVSDSAAALRRMSLYWGVNPVAGAPVNDGAQLLEFVVAKGLAAGYFAAGDRVVMVYGTNLSSAQHNMIVVHEID